MDADSIVIKARVTKRNVEGVGADIHLCVLEPVRAAQASGFTANAAATVSALQLLKKTLAKNSTCKGLSAMPAPAPAPAPAQAFLHRDGEVQHSAHMSSTPMRRSTPAAVTSREESASQCTGIHDGASGLDLQRPVRHQPALRPITIVEPESSRPRTLQIDIRRSGCLQIPRARAPHRKFYN
jgi:hypothetical protein